MNKTKGIALVILSAVIFGITPTMAKYTYTHGSNPVMMTMFRSLLPIPIILAFLLFKKIFPPSDVLFLIAAPLRLGGIVGNGYFCNA